MKRSKLLIVVLAFVLIVPAHVFGQAKVGTTGMQFLKISPSARAVGMADAFLPLASDVSALWYNPAGLVNLPGSGMIFSHTDYPADVSYDFIGYAQPLPMQGAAWGAQVMYLGAGEMDETTVGNTFGTGRTFTASTMAAALTYAMRLTNRFSVGGTGKFLQGSLADENALGWAVDVATFYDTGWRSLRIAMMVSNFGPDMEYISSPFPMPMGFKFAMAGDLYESEDNRVTLAIEGAHPNDNVEELHFGLEYAFNEMAFLRLGKKVNAWKRSTLDEFEDDPEVNNPFAEFPVFDENGGLSFDGFSFGGGVLIPGIKLQVDYAYTTITHFGNLHRFTLMYGGL